MTGWLVYNDSAPKLPATNLTAWDVFDDMTLVPYNDQPLLKNVGTVVTLDLQMETLGNGAN